MQTPPTAAAHFTAGAGASKRTASDDSVPSVTVSLHTGTLPTVSEDQQDEETTTAASDEDGETIPFEPEIARLAANGLADEIQAFLQSLKSSAAATPAQPHSAAVAGSHPPTALAGGSQVVDQPAAEGLTALHWSIIQGHSDIVDLLLDMGASTSVRSDNGKTALLHAADKGHVQIAKRLLARGASVNDIDNDGFSALAMAAYDNNIALLELLVASGADVNAPGPEATAGKTALHQAAVNNSVDAIKFLVKMGANLEACDSKGKTVLMTACEWGQSDAALMLLELGANPNVHDTSGSYVITWAAAGGSVAIMKELLGRGALLMHPEQIQQQQSYQQQQQQQQQQLQQQEEQADSAGDDAPASPHAQSLQQHQIQPKKPTFTSPLHAAINSGRPEMVQFILDYTTGADAKQHLDLDAVDSSLDSPLIAAVKKNQLDVVHLLVKRGASLRPPAPIESKTFDSAITWAAHRGSILKVLLDGLKTNKKQVLDHIDADGSSALHMAITTRNLDAVNMLLRAGTSVNLIEKKSGLSPFEIAASMDELDICSSLMNYGAMVSHKALQLNARTPQKMLAKFLIAGCKAQQPWEIKTENWTPAEVLASTAAERGDADLLRLTTTCKLRMLALPAALHAAATSGHPECCRILLEYGALIQKTETAEKLHLLKLDPSAGPEAPSILELALSQPERFYVGIMPSKIQEIIDGFSLMPYATCMAATLAIVHHPENKFGFTSDRATKVWKRLMQACSIILERFWSSGQISLSASGAPGSGGGNGNGSHANNTTVPVLTTTVNGNTASNSNSSNSKSDHHQHHRNLSEGIASIFYVRALLFMLQSKWDGLLGEVVALLKDNQRLRIFQQASEQSKSRLNALAMYCCHQLGNAKGAKKYAATVPTAGPPTISSLFDAQISSVWREYHDAIFVEENDISNMSSSNNGGKKSKSNGNNSKSAGTKSKSGAANNGAPLYQRSVSERQLSSAPIVAAAALPSGSGVGSGSHVRNKPPRVKSAPIVLDGGIIVEELDDDELPFPPLCSLCSEESQDTALVPCGHSFCEKCASKLRKCPTCHVDVGMTLKMEFLFS